MRFRHGDQPIHSLAHRGATISAVILLALLPPSLLADDLAERRRQVQSLSSAEKRVLQRQAERFQKLTPEQKQRFRSLHRDIDQQADAKQLRATMQRYYAWLRTLPHAKRVELASMPDKERLEAIRNMRQKETAQSFQLAMRSQLDIEDSRIIFEFIRQFIHDHQAEFRNKLPTATLQRLDQIKNPQLKQRTLIMAVRLQRLDDDLPVPTAAELEQLSSRLSSTARQSIGPVLRSPGDHRQLIQQWMTSALAALARPPVNERQLWRYFRELPAERQQQLEKLPRDQLLRDLRRMYQRQQREGQADRAVRGNNHRVDANRTRQSGHDQIKNERPDK